jgi:hypothetical protein
MKPTPGLERQNVVARFRVRRPVTLRFPEGQRYEVYQYLWDFKNPAKIPLEKERWVRVGKEAVNQFSLEPGFHLVKIDGVPAVDLEKRKFQLEMGQVNSWPMAWYYPDVYLDSDPWPPPTDGPAAIYG